VATLGLVYLVLAVAGFVAVGWGTFGYEEPVRVFSVVGTSTLANIVHAFAGVVALVAALRRGASVFAPIGTIAFLAMAVFGVVSRLFPGAGDPLNLTWWNVGLYLLSAIACLYAYLANARSAVDHREPGRGHSE
jgi:fermentation-respiration switch protein FrsA (DUF1100 family)